MATDYAISTEFTAKDRLTSRLNRMSRGMNALKRAAGRVVGAFKRVIRVISFFGRVIKTTASFAAIGIGVLAGAVWKLSSAFSLIEDAEASFTPILGSAAKATEMVEALNKTAASTPFQFENLADTAMQLLPSMNGNIQNTIDLTRMLGDTAGGNAQKMESITRGYNKSLIKGKVDLESLNMIAEAGVPIFQELSKNLGIPQDKLFKSISKGKIKVEDLTGTFKKMTSEGGIFYKGMEIASQTLSGKISTLKDNVTLAMGKIGAAMAPVLKDITDKAIVLAQSLSAWALANQDLIKQKTKEYFDKIKQGIQWVIDNKEGFFTFFRGVKKFGEILLAVTGYIYKNKWAFLVLAAAIKNTYVALRLLSFAGLTEGAAGAASSAVGSIGKVTTKTQKLAGMLGKGGLLFSSFATGWAVGSFIWDTWLSKMDEVATRMQNMAINIQRNAGKMTDSELDTNLNKAIRNKKELSGTWTRIKAGFSGDLQGNISSRHEQDAAILSILKEKLTRLQTGKSIDSNGATVSAQGGGGEIVKKEQMEITIKDETGRAEVTKGRSVKGLPTVNTGGI